MKTIILSAAAALLIVLGAACSKKSTDIDHTAAKNPVADATQREVKPEIASKTPEDWLVIQDNDYIPVIDVLSKELQSARQAFMMKDQATAAADIRATADILSKETMGAARGSKENIEVAMKQLSSLAADLDSKKTVDVRRFDAVIAAARRADLDRDVLVVDEQSWYPYIQEPDRHFQNAHQAFLAKDYEKAAQEIRKGEAFVKLEASSANGDVRPSLQSSAQELERLAAAMRKGTVKDVRDVDNIFSRADHVLAQSHQVKAKESWTKKETVRTGYEMKAAALLLEQSAGWAGNEAKTGAAAIVADTRTLAGKLTAGGEYAAAEVDKGLDELGKSISDLVHKT